MCHPLIGKDNAKTSNVRVPGDLVVVVDTNQLESLDRARRLAGNLLGQVGAISSIPSGKRVDIDRQPTQRQVALVTGTPARGRPRSRAVAGEEVELLAAADAGGAVEPELEVALQALRLVGVLKGEQGGDVLAVVAVVLGDLAMVRGRDGTVADRVQPSFGGVEVGFAVASLEGLGLRGGLEGRCQDRGGGDGGGEYGLEEHFEVVEWMDELK